ncbi:MAG TPA: HAMP domain-containing sensor histidine kinase [Burkholderiales bacterium]
MRFAVQWSLKGYLRDLYQEGAQLPLSRMQMIGWFGFICMPLFYFVWHDLAPQPYESLPLRLFSLVFSLPLVLSPWLPASFRVAYPVLFWGLVTYCLPFFFTFMLLSNRGSEGWVQSCISGVFLFFFLGHWRYMLQLTIFGIVVGILSYMIFGAGQFSMSPEFMRGLPVIIFSLVAAGLFNVWNSRDTHRRLTAVWAASSTVAHELRTPLLSLKFSAETILDSTIPVLAPAAPPAGTKQLDESVHRIINEVDQMLVNIDLLLANARTPEGPLKVEAIDSIRALVELAISSFPFASAKDQRMVTVVVGEDFATRGNTQMLQLVFYNLLKNAIKSVKSKGGKRSIEVQVDAQAHSVVFRDSGVGISPQVIGRIFEQFYSFPEGSGTGIGLSFCRQIMAAMGGEIRVASRPGEGASFFLRFHRP